MDIADKKEEIKNCINQQQYDEALRLVEVLLDSEPLNADYLCLKADINKKKGLWGDALNQYNKILEHYPEHQQAQIEKGMIQSIFNLSNIDIFDCTNLYDDPWF